MLIFCAKTASLSYVRLIHNTQNVLTTLPDIFNEKHLIASTTKIMTAVLAIESGKLDDMVTINESILKSHGSGIYIKEGEKISLRNLVYGLLLRSGNDAALAIEDYLGGHDKFVNKMNEKAGEIGMKNTVFNNPSGLDDDETGNYSTCYDMALLMKYANWKLSISYIFLISVRNRIF